MSKNKKSKKITVQKISGKELLMNSEGKLGKHMEQVRTGTGAHKSKKHYNRKGKKNQQLKASLKKYGPSAVDFFCLRSILFEIV